MRPPEFLRFGIFYAYLFVNYVYEDPFFFKQLDTDLKLKLMYNRKTRHLLVCRKGKAGEFRIKIFRHVLTLAW